MLTAALVIGLYGLCHCSMYDESLHDFFPSLYYLCMLLWLESCESVQ